MDQVSKYDDLAVKYPDLVGGSKFGGFAVGDGWYGLIDGLCGMITHYVKTHNDDVDYRLQQIAEGKRTEKDYSPDLLVKREMPKIRQVKEKFGGLRFYVDTTDKRIHHWIEFAEVVSTKICEECGAPGERRGEGWVRTLCDFHEAEYQKKIANR